MSDVKREQLMRALKTINHPKLNQNIVDSGTIQGLVVKDGAVGFALSINPDDVDEMEKLRQSCDRLLMQISGVNKVTSVLTAERDAGAEKPSGGFGEKRSFGGHGTPPPQEGPAGIPGVKHVIAVASGKGGVGKSTTSINLALAFNKLGLKAGIFDLDIYGPSIPRLMGLDDARPEVLKDDKITPLKNHEIVSMSIGYLMEKDTAVIWRGPMVMGTIQQMLNDVKWDLYSPLDVLIIDLPPGTGDAQLTMVQNIKLDGAVIVSTPQDLALIDARKALTMFDKTNTNIFGIIENMSYFICPHCGERSDIFSHGGACETAKEKNMDFLGSIPLDMDIRKSSDDGTPIVASQPDSPHTKAYVEIADKILEKLS
ncbi:MAG: Mrp/NBP35 family ATP-binding protein [Kordiimonadaceae bacterium]|jgi:ATP-binding protein involved in chromosome partitioning|nr:Mrp/NBP35 family ATP-binding protein [Kordiimonadaceae bacterium]MBT6036115.1 Mrp/NBP35 family ATP-binding protein [Kordiimonadaceae bacterium]MBT6329904.1 Mrp/NBP35 family ATP-binding protein [Kordiimonadaceae bacterium]MBT7582094.1 Mrp/NBP35 family ATP-binding protein [Kordiimonadaceae bacterium]